MLITRESPSRHDPRWGALSLVAKFAASRRSSSAVRTTPEAKFDFDDEQAEQMMTPGEAKSIILSEGNGEDGIVRCLRMGNDPGPARMHALVSAVRVLFHRIAGHTKIGREVAAALFTLGTEVPAQLESWQGKGCTWREGLVQSESVLLLLAIESVFTGEWLAGDIGHPGEPGPTTITVESRRKTSAMLSRIVPEALILDLTSKGPEPWVRFSPFYPHGGIPVPDAPGVFARSVEGLWQGLKVFEHEDIDPSRWESAGMRGIKRAGTKRGKVLGHRLGPNSDVLLGYREARYEIYLPAYRWVLEHRLTAEIEQLRREWALRPLVLLDYETNGDVENVGRPLSHAALVKAYLEGTWPARPTTSTR